MKTTDKLNFGQRLREAFKGASQTEIARQLGVSNSAVTNYVEGRVPPAEKLIKIADLTGYSIHWLITGDGPKRVYEQKSRCQTIMLANVMSGVAKSASATLLALEFAKRGYRTLLIDTAKGHCAEILFGLSISGLGFWRTNSSNKPKRKIQQGRMFFETELSKLHLCESNDDKKSLLAAHGVKTFNIDVESIKREYDFVVMDTNVVPFAQSDMFTYSLITVAHVLIPTRADTHGVSAVKETLELFNEAHLYLPDIRLLGAFLTIFYPSGKTASIVARELHRVLPEKTLETKINVAEDLAGLGSYSQSEIVRKKSPGFAKYSQLADEVLHLMRMAMKVKGAPEIRKK